MTPPKNAPSWCLNPNQIDRHLSSMNLEKAGSEFSQMVANAAPLNQIGESGGWAEESELRRVFDGGDRRGRAHEPVGGEY
jgi:hypothetical protein